LLSDIAENGGQYKVKRPLLLTMLLLIVVALLIPNIYATTTNQQNTEIITNTSISQDNNASIYIKTSDNPSTTAAGSPGAVTDTKVPRPRARVHPLQHLPVIPTTFDSPSM